MSSTGHDSNAPLEKDFSQRNGGYTNGNGSQHLHENMDPDIALKRIRTAGSISISPELFEKMYLSPQNQVKGDLRKTFGNPTPLALAGFLLCLSPLSADLMGWRGAGGNGAASTGVYYFFGGIMMMLGGFLEFILGNTFPFVVFMSFGAFWLSFGSTLQPFYNAYGAYSTTGEVADGLKTVGFNSSFAFFLVFMGVLCLVYFVCSLRTNLIFALIFLLLVPAFGCLSGAFWQGANAYAAAEAGDLAASAQHAETAHRCQTAGGALAFVVCMLGWYLFFGIMLAALDFPFQLPVFDLSHIITGASEKANRRQENIDNLEPSA